jgi:predicted ATPase
MSTSVVSPVFVGRQEEIASLTALLDRVQRSEPAFALIGGEAGVGKTRLLGELAAQAGRAGFTVLLGHCIELGAEGLPLAPVVDALRALTRAIPADELAQVVGPAAPGLARLLPELSPDPPARMPAEGIQSAQLLELVLGLLGRLSAVRPVLLVLEDLHWADQSTLELVAFLVRSLRAVQVLLVATYRSDELHRRHPLRPLLTGWERVRTVDRVELLRFQRDEVATQLAAILAAEPGPGLVDLVFDRSGGNAYLVEELAGVVRRGGDPWSRRCSRTRWAAAGRWWPWGWRCWPTRCSCSSGPPTSARRSPPSRPPSWSPRASWSPSRKAGDSSVARPSSRVTAVPPVLSVRDGGG